MQTMAATRSRKTGDGDFAQRLRSIRMQRNFSQAELAEKAGLHFTSVSRYETSGVHPNADALKRLSQALGVTGDYLIEGATQQAARVNLEDRDLLAIFQQVDELPQDDKQFFKRVMETLLVKYKVQSISR